MANRLTCPLSCWSPWGPPSLDLLLTLAPFTFLAKVMGFLCSAQGLLILLIVLEGGWTTAQPSVVGSSVRAWPTLGDEPHFSVWPLKHSKQSIPHEFTRQSVTVEVPSTGREGLTVLGTALSISPGWVFLVFQYFPSDIFVHILLSFFLGFYVFGLFLKFQKKNSHFTEELPFICLWKLLILYIYFVSHYGTELLAVNFQLVFLGCTGKE